ncbi:MAG: RagB/SusD family nutrient uptake outer membrane protein [Thalassobius sp.]|nr:RagB/SusD family nutrient uptake outer membrane protein [Thalassovita sp.]
MKNKLYIFLSLTLFIVCSCSEDFLDLQPNGAPSSDNYWQSEDQVVAAANAMYAPFTEDIMYGRGYFWYINASDDMVTGRVKSEPDNIKNFINTGNESYTKNIWALKYKVIKRANEVIVNVADLGEDVVSTEVKERSMGEAYFLSGLMYLDLAYRFGDQKGGVPIVDREDLSDYNVARAESVEVNYEYIISEFEKAAELLPYFSEYSSENMGRAHKTAAYAFMAKTYLYWAQYDASKYALAIEAADKVINSGEHALIDTDSPAEDYKAVFSSANNWGSEYIWSVVSSTLTGSILPGVMFENKGWGLYNGWGYFQPTKELYDEYEEGDVRRDITVFKDGTVFTYFGEEFTWYQTSNNETGYMFGKYTEPFSDQDRVNPNGDKPSTDLNVPLMRFAEILLIKAEAQIASGLNGDEALNMVRTRAGLSALSGATLDDLKHERRCELAGEWTDRHFDLVRWGDADEVYNQELHAHDGTVVWEARPQFDPEIHHVWPIPPDEISASLGVLTQNEGW